ncbi:YncE family protein [Microlunatus ginsengisoli]|uniref:YncE family protein n=1 Tax=Microlunatus ginsengisoli TaxID=363863 RepID=A0ABP6ZQM9_9ACTN
MSVHRRIVASAAAGAIALSVAVTGTASAAPAMPTAAAAAKAPAVHTVGVGSNPYAVAVSQSLGKAFVVNDGSVSVVSLLTHRELTEFGTGNNQYQNDIALMRSNTQGYITDNAMKNLTVIDTETYKVAKQIPVGYGAIGVVKANTSAGQRAYVITAAHAGPQGSGARNELVAIQTSTGKVVARTKLPQSPGAVVVAPGAKSVWVGGDVDGKIFQVSTKTGKITKTWKPTKAGPITALAFAPGGKKVWITGLAGVSVISAKSGKSAKFITAPKIFPGFIVPNDVVLNASGKYAFVENSVQNAQGDVSAVAAINTKTYKVAWRVKTGSQPEGMALDKTRGVAYVPNYDDDTVSYFSVPK